MRRRFSLVALCVLLAASQAFSLTLYVKRTFAAEPGVVRIGDLVQALGELSAEAKDFLDKDVGSVSDKVLVVPSSLYRGEFEKRLGGNLILVGKRTLVFPRGTAVERDFALLSLLIESIDQAGFADSVAEISLVQLQKPSESVPVSRLAFQPVRVEKRSGLYDGAAEFAIRDSAGESGVSIGRISIRIAQQTKPGAAAPTVSRGDESTEPYLVQANDQVAVTFMKGAIAIEMPGRAQGSASMGRTVSVYVPESKLSFTGLVTGERAVTVDIQ